MEIRDARPADMEAVTAIYNDAIRHSRAVWTETPVDVADRRRWLAGHRRAGDAVLVAVDGDGTIVGYASFGAWRPWEGYRHTVEHSLYVRSDRHRQGIGRALLLQLVERARAAGKHAMVAGIEAENAASIRLHRRLGFEPVGRLSQVGSKFGAWLDLLFLERLLDERPAPPAPPGAR